MKVLFLFDNAALTDQVYADLWSISLSAVPLTESAIDLGDGRTKLTIHTPKTISEIEAMNLGQSFVKRCGV